MLLRHSSKCMFLSCKQVGLEISNFPGYFGDNFESLCPIFPVVLTKVSSRSEDSEFNHIPEYVAMESEIAAQSGEIEDREDNIKGPNSNEPLAYRKKK